MADHLQLIQNVFDSLAAHIAVLDENGVIVAVNDSWRRFAAGNGGIEARCNLGVDYLQTCAAGDEKATAAASGIRAVLSGKLAGFSMEYSCHAPTEERWFSLKVLPLGGGAKGVVTTHENITVLVQAEQRAREKANRLGREAAALATISASPKLAAGEVAELARELTVLASPTLAVERVGVWLFTDQGSRLVSLDIYEASRASHSAGAVLEEQQFQNEFAVLKKAQFVDAHDALTDPRTAGYVAGYLKPLGIMAMLDAVIRSGDRILGVLCFEQVGAPRRWENEDISFACQMANQLALAITIRERKRAEATLQQSEELFRKMFDDHSAINLIINPETGEIINANKAAAAFYGWSIEALRQMRIEQINTLPTADLKIEFQMARTAEKNRFEFRHRRADGSVRDVEVYSNLIATAGKSLLYSIIHDITERRRAEAEREKLATQNRQLQKNESLGRMAGAIAHHYNNQLQSMLLSLNLCREDLLKAEVDPDALGNLTIALDASKKLVELGHGLLLYLGVAQTKAAALDISAIYQQQLPVLRAIVPPAVSLATELPSPGPVVLGNASQLKQTLTNLVTNAAEAMSDTQGAILISVKTVGAAEIPAANRYPVDFQPLKSRYVCLVVADAGCGIEEKNLEFIFDPFFTSKVTGRGLGLAVVLGIVREHRGVITVKSQPGWGSTFRIFLPCHPAA